MLKKKGIEKRQRKVTQEKKGPRIAIPVEEKGRIYKFD